MRILVVDDHALFRDGIVSLLIASGFEIIGQAENGAQAVAAALALRPDLVLMDVSMPEMSGLEALREIKRQAPEIQVVMLTISDDDNDLLAAIQAGARGYLLKNLNSKAFFEGLEALKRGEVAMAGKTMARLFEKLAEVKTSAPATYLTERETELLKLVAAGLPNREIAQRLFISENTVKYHLKSVLQKLGVKNRAEAVSSAIQKGIIPSL
jgi:DNA-binding NarL/FixJ family response regulator